MEKAIVDWTARGGRYDPARDNVCPIAGIHRKILALPDRKFFFLLNILIIALWLWIAQVWCLFKMYLLNRVYRLPVFLHHCFFKVGIEYPKQYGLFLNHNLRNEVRNRLKRQGILRTQAGIMPSVSGMQAIEWIILRLYAFLLENRGQPSYRLHRTPFVFTGNSISSEWSAPASGLVGVLFVVYRTSLATTVSH